MVQLLVIDRPRLFDPVRHGQVTVIYENDNFLWNGGDRDRGWDRDVEHLEYGSSFQH